MTEGIKNRTPLHLAVKYDLYKYVEILVVEQKVDPNPVDGKKNTPLFYAKKI